MPIKTNIPLDNIGIKSLKIIHKKPYFYKIYLEANTTSQLAKLTI
jgi:hypothetical protein